MSAVYLSAACAHDYLRCGAVVERASALEDADTASRGGPCNTASIVERVQVSARRVVEAARITRGRKCCADFFARHVTQAFIVIAVTQCCKLGMQCTLVTRFQCDLHLTALPVAVD